MFDPDRHRRRSIRLKGYDYAQAGVYFVTICTQGHVCRFGDVIGGVMRLNDAGRMVWGVWESLPSRFPTVDLDAFVVMPNHVHGVFGTRPVPSGGRTTVGDVVGALKSLVTVEYACGVNARGWSPFDGALFQRNYYEHIVRDDEALDRIRAYVLGNPTEWERDRENPSATGPERGHPRGVPL